MRSSRVPTKTPPPEARPPREARAEADGRASLHSGCRHDDLKASRDHLAARPRTFRRGGRRRLPAGRGKKDRVGFRVEGHRARALLRREVLDDVKRVGGVLADDRERSVAVRAEDEVRVGIEDPGVQSVQSSVGSGGPNSSSNSGSMFITLKPRGERPSSDEIIERLRPKLARVPALRFYLQTPPSISVGGQNTRSQYQLTLQSTDTAALYSNAAPRTWRRSTCVRRTGRSFR